MSFLLGLFGGIIIIISFISIFLFGILSLVTFPIIFCFGLMCIAVAQILSYVQDKEAKAYKNKMNEKAKEIANKNCNDLNEVIDIINKKHNELNK